MKRIHLFEFEDQSWFADWIRVRMTSMLGGVHRLFGTALHLVKLIDQSLGKSGASSIIDLCSGGSGPILKSRHQDCITPPNTLLVSILCTICAVRRVIV